MSLDADLLRASFALVIERQPQLTSRFYAILFERYPALVPMFDPRRRARQEKMLAEALVAVLDHLEQPGWLASQLAGLGARHVGYGVTAPMYDWVSECLRAALAEAAGEAWTDAMDRAWRDALAAIRDLMLAGAEQEQEEPTLPEDQRRSVTAA